MPRTNQPVPTSVSSAPENPAPRVSPGRLVGYGFGALIVTAAGTWGLAELATPPGTGLATADLSSLGRTVGLIAAAAVGVPAAILAYHRQRALDTSNRNAADQHEHKVMADNREHQTGIERHLRERYTTCAEQLGHENFAIRLAGVYALASLADDWHGFGNGSERQVCIDLLCAYVRVQHPAVNQREEDQVRTAVIDAIRARTSAGNDSWTECEFDLSGADLAGLDLSHTRFNRLKLAKANLDDANFSCAILPGADFTDAHLAGARLDCAEVPGAVFAGADLIAAKMYTSNFTLADFVNADLTGTELNFTDLIDADLSGANLTGADLSNARMNHAILEGATLACATMSGVDLGPITDTVSSSEALAELRSGRHFERLSFDRSIFSSHCNGATLAGANLTEAVMNGANLTDADLSDAALSGADLRGAELRGANLTNARLANANLAGAILENTEMEGARPSEAVWTDDGL